MLPVGYVIEHLELGYAVTAHPAQGITTDTSHALIEPPSTRETLYVAMTRGRTSSTAYVATERLDEEHSGQHPGTAAEPTAGVVLRAVLQHSGAQPPRTRASPPSKTP